MATTWCRVSVSKREMPTPGGIVRVLPDSRLLLCLLESLGWQGWWAFTNRRTQARAPPWRQGQKGYGQDPGNQDIFGSSMSSCDQKGQVSDSSGMRRPGW